jgi:AAA+ ATPase superfamily predicted ATPase
MTLRFFDRRAELDRLRALLRHPQGRLAVVYGRRRCGKSRLLLEALRGRRAVYYVGDERDSALQREALAREIARILPAFSEVRYPHWQALLERFWNDAPRSILVLDEFPALAAAEPALPSLLQKLVDREAPRQPHVILAGSSQRLMQGLVLDSSAPLFGRAREILKLPPLPAGWIKPALGLADDVAAVEAYAFWGGVPRYWELAAEHGGLVSAFEALALSPLGVLHDEPRRLLLDDAREASQPLSVLALIGAGCHRLSEIAGGLGKPATSLSRPLATLVELGFVRRELPFGASPQDSKRSAYRLADPFLQSWFRFVEPNRSRLEAGLSARVAREVEEALPLHVSQAYEELVRASVPRTSYHGLAWGPAARWWGPGTDRVPLELDLVAEGPGDELLVGEVKWQHSPDWPREREALRRKAERLPLARGKHVRLALWGKRAPARGVADACFDARRVMASLR